MFQYHPFFGWFLHRVKRILPYAFITFMLFICWHKLRQQTSKHQYHSHMQVYPEPKQRVIPEPTTEPSTTWVILKENTLGVTDTCTAALPLAHDWHIIVLHQKPKPVFRHSKCVYIHHLPSEKSVSDNGWMKALQHAIQAGANVVISVNDTNQLNDLNNFKIEPESSYLKYEKPSSKCSDIKYSMNGNPELKLYQGISPAIQGFVTRHGLICDARAPGLLLDEGLFARIASSPVIFQKQAFWAFFLTLPQFSNLRNVLFYFVQKLLWISKNYVFVRSNSKYFEAEYNGQYMVSIQEKVCNWKCNSDNFAKCFKQLAQDFLKLDFFSKEIYDSLIDWLNIFSSKNYIFPKISNSSNIIFKDKINITAITFHCNKTLPKIQNDVNNKLLKDTCTNYNELNKMVSQPWIQFNDVLFIVIFNNPHFEALPYIQLLYANFFPYMIYCGPEVPHLQKEYEFSYISYGSTPDGHFAGAFNYKCVSIAMQLGFNVSGYLVMGDDVLLNLYKIAHYDRHVTWYLPKEEIRIGDILTGKQCRLRTCNSYAHWRWWEDYRSELLTALAELEQFATTSLTFHRCYFQLVKLNGGPKRANGGYADLYYIPEHLSKNFIEISHIFYHRNVFLELAIPTIIRCLENPDNIKPLPGFQDQYESRDKPWDKFEKIRGKAYIHPSKLGPIATKSLDHRSFFCHKVLPFIYDQHGRIRTGNFYMWNQ